MLSPRALESDGPGSSSWQRSAHWSGPGQGNKLSTHFIKKEKILIPNLTGREDFSYSHQCPVQIQAHRSSTHITFMFIPVIEKGGVRCCNWQSLASAMPSPVVMDYPTLCKTRNIISLPKKVQTSYKSCHCLNKDKCVSSHHPTGIWSMPSACLALH